LQDKYILSSSGVTANADRMTSNGIKYAFDQEIHRKERYAKGTPLTYELPAPKGSKYVLILEFADV